MPGQAVGLAGRFDGLFDRWPFSDAADALRRRDSRCNRASDDLSPLTVGGTPGADGFGGRTCTFASLGWLRLTVVLRAVSLAFVELRFAHDGSEALASSYFTLLAFSWHHGIGATLKFHAASSTERRADVRPPAAFSGSGVVSSDT